MVRILVKFGKSERDVELIMSLVIMRRDPANKREMRSCVSFSIKNLLDSVNGFYNQSSLYHVIHTHYLSL